MLKILKKSVVAAIMTVLVFGVLVIPKVVVAAPEDLGQCFCIPAESLEGTPDPSVPDNQAGCLNHYIDNGPCPFGCERITTVSGEFSGKVDDTDGQAIIEELTLACEAKITEWKRLNLVSTAPAGADSSGCPAGFTCLTSPLTNPSADVPYIIGMVIRGFMGIAGALVLLMVVWGAQKWLIAAGKSEKIQEGTHTIIWALVGALVLFLAYILLNQVLGVLSTGEFKVKV